MAKKKIVEEVPEVVEVKPKKKPNKKQLADNTAKEKPEQVYIYHTGDDLEKISEILTGRKYMEYAILQASGVNMNTLKDGDVLKWGL